MCSVLQLVLIPFYQVNNLNDEFDEAEKQLKQLVLIPFYQVNNLNE